MLYDEGLDNMKINKTTFYALRIIYRIYMEESVIVTSCEIAKKEKISQGVSMKILSKLVRAGILQVHQGRGQICGGFSLLKNIDEITMLEILEIMEGMDICRNLAEIHKTTHQLLMKCSEFSERINDIGSQYTIHDLFGTDI